MEVTTKELRIQPGRIIEQVAGGQEIVVTFRGTPLARIVPFSTGEKERDDLSIFGMWEDRFDAESVEEQVRELRKGRLF